MEEVEAEVEDALNALAFESVTNTKSYFINFVPTSTSYLSLCSVEVSDRSTINVVLTPKTASELM